VQINWIIPPEISSIGVNIAGKSHVHRCPIDGGSCLHVFGDADQKLVFGETFQVVDYHLLSAFVRALSTPRAPIWLSQARDTWPVKSATDGCYSRVRCARSRHQGSVAAAGCWVGL